MTPLRAIVLIPDDKELNLLRDGMQKIGIDLYVCADAEELEEALQVSRFAAVIVDCDGSGTEILKALQSKPTTHGTVSFALTAEAAKRKEAVALGATFVLDKPLSQQATDRCLHIAQKIIQNEQRKYARVPLDISVGVSKLSSSKQFVAKATNIGAGGMALATNSEVSVGTVVEFSLTLPGEKKPFSGQAKVIWEDSQGRAGVQFTYLSPAVRELLEQWLQTPQTANV